MFFIFLNKDDAHYLDFSVFQQYTPSQVLVYFYDSFIKIPLQTYLQVKELSKDESMDSPCNGWVELLDTTLEVSTDINILQNSEYINIVGPYYFPPTNTRFYFTKEAMSANETLTAEDLATIIALDDTPPMERNIYNYHKGRKNSKKTAKNKDELLMDISMCIASLREIEKLNKHLNYLNKYLEKRYKIVEQEELRPGEPDTLPEKPDTSAATEVTNSNVIPFNVITRRRKQNEKAGGSFNHDMKVYFIRYREYEKACDRYKTVLENWEQHYRELMDNCFHDIELAEEKLRNSHKYLRVYNSIVEKSFIHSAYQDIYSLNLFKSYLETGRANDLQDCMNLFEEEKHWDEIKASQERIENTIYFLQSGNENLRFVNEQFDQFFKQIDEKHDPGIAVVKDQ